MDKVILQALAEIPYEKVGFWGMLFFTLLKDLVYPSVNKYFPHLLRKSEREQDREDKQLVFEQQMKLRQVEAMENISSATMAINNFMLHVTSKLDSIENKITEHHSAMQEKSVKFEKKLATKK